MGPNLGLLVLTIMLVACAFMWFWLGIHCSQGPFLLTWEVMFFVSFVFEAVNMVFGSTLSL